jgi:hypothetical protein
MSDVVAERIRKLGELPCGRLASLALGGLRRSLDRYDHPFMQSLSRILYHTIRRV